MGAYKEAGVDIDAKMEAIASISEQAAGSYSPAVLSGIGHFGGFFSLAEAGAPAYAQAAGYKEPVLVASADGVGTKLKLAVALGRHEGIGRDLVNHCVNDILVCGAFPLFFLDYFAAGKLDAVALGQLVAGMAAACKEAGCALLGGETAEMPGVYRDGDYDVAGFIVGMVEKERILNGAKVGDGDVLLGLPSTGLHTNGYSLVRHIFDLDPEDAEQAAAKLNEHYDELGGSLGDALLAVHQSYLPQLGPILAASANDSRAPQIKAMAHITGGGFYDNLPRVLPEHLAVKINAQSWQVPPLFRLIQQRGQVSSTEMYRVFNMGIGMVLIAGPRNAEWLSQRLQTVQIGEVVRRADGGPQVEISGLEA